MTLTPEQIEQCWEIIRQHAPKSISWNHYDLAIYSEIDQVEVWKAFQQIREVAEWLEEERILLQRSEFAKLSTNVSNSRSTGQAQLLSAMDKINGSNKAETATGPIFIYTYVPLTEEQRKAPNTVELKEDIFFVDSAQEGFKFDPIPDAPTGASFIST